MERISALFPVDPPPFCYIRYHRDTPVLGLRCIEGSDESEDDAYHKTDTEQKVSDPGNQQDADQDLQQHQDYSLTGMQSKLTVGFFLKKRDQSENRNI